MADQKTHTEVKKPQISMSRLADYMAASEQAKRTIVQSCKYRATVRVVQHNEAKATIASYIRKGETDTSSLIEKADYIRSKLADDDFEAEVNDHNASYVERFAKIAETVSLPKKAEIQAGEKFPALPLGGVAVTFVPQLLLQRVSKTNVAKRGAVMLRYAKGKALSPVLGEWQSAGIFGYLRTLDVADMKEAEKELCLTLDAYTGAIYPAPSKSVYFFNEMKAACASIAERWPAIQPPKNAVL
jgi:hypothetical protein